MQIVANPFKFGKEVRGCQFYDRTDAFETLYRKLAGGAANVVMYAPRRYGKTSLVRKVLDRFQAEGAPTVYFDFSKIESVERFCEEYASALYAVTGKAQRALQRIADYLQHLHPTLSLGGDAPVSIRFDYGARMSATSLSSVLDLAEKLAVDELGQPLVVAFDEFQDIDALSAEIPMEAVFRSCIQAHQNVRYVFLGSKTHLMKRMFADKARPFYKSAATIRLEKPPEAESVAFVKERFASVAIDIGDDLAARIVSEAANVPYYVQQLSALTFDIVAAGGRTGVTAIDIDAGIAAVLDENADYYVTLFGMCSPTQKRLVAALAREPTAAFTEDYRRRHALGSPSTVHSALNAVVEAGLVESDAAEHAVGDPFFARYICTGA